MGSISTYWCVNWAILLNSGYVSLTLKIVVLGSCFSKPKTPWQGFLHFAAALVPLGLFIAALQPSVIHVNSSQ